jgi:serine/threonine protein kinase
MVLGDFGLARQMIAASGRTILAGTPEYVAPEQADPKLAATVDERADVYAAAVILHERDLPSNSHRLPRRHSPTEGVSEHALRRNGRSRTAVQHRVGLAA